MAEAVQCETPENIELSYRPAGLGTRFLASFIDWLLQFVVLFLLVLLLVCVAAAWLGDQAQRVNDALEESPMGETLLYIGGFLMLVWGIGSFFYFGLSELFLRGQTIGKRMTRIRVVKADGFSLDAIGILVRNVFRVVDQLPPLWIVPLLSKRSQRLGDMVAGTVVVADVVESLSRVREALLERPAAEAMFRFDASELKKLRPEDVSGTEQILDRLQSLPPDLRDSLVSQVAPALASRMGVDEPAEAERVRFLQDLLAAEFRRQNRQLG